ncbi:Armadillo-type fold domain containing protein [Sesbania bispinosa]|nr:Armadillo-type fold domain containing protein [Sesbania bispinosa]
MERDMKTLDRGIWWFLRARLRGGPLAKKGAKEERVRERKTWQRANKKLLREHAYGCSSHDP